MISRNSLLLCFFLCNFYINALPIRSKEEIESFENFLRNSVNGNPIKPVTEEVAILQNLWENSGKFQGDIVLTEEQIKELVQAYSTRNAVSLNFQLWPDKTIYYNINASDFTPAQINAIRAGVGDLVRLSCLRFIESTSHKAYINVRGRDDGCYATVGYTGLKQNLNLAPSNPGSGCFTHGTIVHEFLHALGFYHMQSANERNDWVKIIWDKIIFGTELNFVRMPSMVITNLNQEYDYGSVMHYSEYSFSTDGNKTIIPLQPTTETIGQRIGMSAKDIIKLNMLYKC